MQCSDVKKKLFWVTGVKSHLKPMKKCDTGYSWKWTKQNAETLVKNHQDTKPDVGRQGSAWNHGTMQITANGTAVLPKYNDFLSDTKTLIQ